MHFHRVMVRGYSMNASNVLNKMSHTFVLTNVRELNRFDGKKATRLECKSSKLYIFIYAYMYLCNIILDRCYLKKIIDQP